MEYLVIQDIVLLVPILALLHLRVVVKVEPVATKCTRRPPSVAYLILAGFLSALEAPFFELFSEKCLARVFLCWH